MRGFVSTILSLSLALSLALSLVGTCIGLAAQPAFSQTSPQAGVSLLDQHRAKANENVVTIISGNPNGGYLTIAHDIAAVVDDGDDLRVLPIVGRGAVGNVRDVLFLKGVDMGLVNTVTLNNFKRSHALGRHVAQQVVYITRLFEDEFHVLARPEIKELKDLDGKEVNYSDSGSGAQLSAQLMFAGFGIKPKEVNMGQADAIEKMKRGEVFATVCTCLKPLRPYQAVPKELGFRLLPIPLDGPMLDDYVPATFTSADYPNLVPEGTAVEAVAVPTSLIAYNWPANHERYRRIARFVDAFFGKFEAFHKAPRHPRWKAVNLTAELKGWTRLKAAQEWLDKVPAQRSVPSASPGIDTVLARAQAARAAPASLVEQERLFQQFLEWSRQQGK
ncbi:MAG: ABC transporter substrate-binding protein [Hyphomonadaceae bacterium]|nr:ABC transporter substrate-binding protein [Hyphomonadaceae bacterium]